MTYGEKSFAEQGNYGDNALQDLCAAIGALLAPEDMPPGR